MGLGHVSWQLVTLQAFRSPLHHLTTFLFWGSQRLPSPQPEEYDSSPTSTPQWSFSPPPKKSWFSFWCMSHVQTHAVNCTDPRCLAIVFEEKKCSPRALCALGLSKEVCLYSSADRLKIDCQSEGGEKSVLHPDRKQHHFAVSLLGRGVHHKKTQQHVIQTLGHEAVF